MAGPLGRRCWSARFLTLMGVAGLVHTAFAGTVGWWRFEEGAGRERVEGIGAVLDSSANQLHGTCASPAGAIYDQALAPFGKGALTLSGPGSWVFVPDSPKLRLTRSLTLEAFVNIRAFQTHGVANFILFRGDNRSGTDAYWLALNPFGQTLNFGVEGQGARPGDPPALVTTPFSRYLGETVHVAGVVDDEADSLTLYVNGRPKATMQTHIRPRAELHPLHQPGLGIGGFFAGPAPASFALDGVIDEARISNVGLHPEQFLGRQEALPED